MIEGVDLEERTAVFGEAVIAFYRQLPRDDLNSVPMRQLVRSGTSVGANYCEASDAETRKDFRRKIGLCRKEARETKLWLRMVASAVPDHVTEARRLWQAAHELNLVFSKIRRRLK